MKYLQANRKPAVKVHTVNVIEIVNEQLNSVRSFVDNPAGNKRAERMFRRLYREHNDPDGTTGEPRPTNADIDPYIEDGVYDDECGYQLVLAHSV